MTARRVKPDPLAVERALLAYPELAFYAALRPDRVVTLADALDSYPEPERTERRGNLNKSIAWERVHGPSDLPERVRVRRTQATPK